ncbi:MAG TPA: hypothetical protein VGP15_16660 [Burkholderiales bacterium]|jgi:hypothetical protein|nr:hypothetical protein [Burkholderiales bacterium]
MRNAGFLYQTVMIHGAAQTGSNFTGTPEGRKGMLEKNNLEIAGFIAQWVGKNVR